MDRAPEPGPAPGDLFLGGRLPWLHRQNIEGCNIVVLLVVPNIFIWYILKTFLMLWTSPLATSDTSGGMGSAALGCFLVFVVSLQGSSSGAQAVRRTGLQHIPEWFSLAFLWCYSGTAVGTICKDCAWPLYLFAIGSMAVAGRWWCKSFASSLPRPVGPYV